MSVYRQGWEPPKIILNIISSCKKGKTDSVVESILFKTFFSYLEKKEVLVSVLLYQ